MRGYKVFNSDWMCRGFQYAVGEIFEENVTPECCDRGFHYCKDLKDCFNYYNFNPENKVAEIIALGDIDEENDGKCCTNKIQIVKEISWEEVLRMVNLGKGCTGLCNSGDWNSGDSNSGDWNSGDQSVGCFNTESQKLHFFDKETDMTFDEWRSSRACYLLDCIDFRPTKWIWESDMTDEEKGAHPEYKTCGRYLKDCDPSDCCIDWWNDLSNPDKYVIQNMPNFDAKKFYEITGIEV